MHYDSGFSKSWYVGVEEAICIDMGTRYKRYDILNQDHQNHRSTQRELQQQKAEKGEIYGPLFAVGGKVDGPSKLDRQGLK